MMQIGLIVKTVVPAALILACLWQATKASSSGADAANASELLASVQHDLAELRSLRSSTRQVSWGARPEADVIGLARSAAAQAGLPDTAVQGVRPVGDRPVPGQPRGQEVLREQTVRIDLRRIRAQDLGGFLRAWQAAAPRWTVSAIEMNSGQPVDASTGVFEVSISVAAPYAEESDS